jgi:leader peptidase (prepilin peptidase)/N-methyltransferase
MGDGDVTLMAMIGSFLGWQLSLVVFFMLAPIFALFVTVVTFSLRFDRPIPFGPYLSAGALAIVFLWRPTFSHLDTFFSRGPFLFIVFILMAAVFFPLLLLIRAVKRLFGFSDAFEDEYEDVWTSADQLSFYANKEERQARTTLQQTSWPGVSSGQGTVHSDRWRGSK